MGNNILIGAPDEDTAGAADAGAAYLFDGLTGSLLQTFLNPSPAALDHFVSGSGRVQLISSTA
jgi:hypothetical protein